MFLKTLPLEWVVILFLSLRGSHANNISSIYSSSSGSVTKSPSTKSSSSEVSKSASPITSTSSAQTPLITSCAPVNFSTYFAPSLQALPSAEFAAVAQSKYSKYAVDFESLARYIATPPSDTAAARAFITSEAKFISDDVQSLFGTYGYGPIHFSSLYTNPCLFSQCLNSFSTASSFFMQYEEPAIASSTWYFPGAYDFIYAPSPPCCGDCVIIADEVQVKYWPTPAQPSAASTLIDVSRNITYISPSVYVSIRDIRATDACGTIGGFFSTYTNSYLPKQLSSSVVPFSFEVIPSIGNWTSINFADFDSPKCKCTANCKSDPVLHTVLTNLCTPQLSLPPGVNSLDPLWATCTMNSFGIFDPPFALTVQPGLTAPKATPASPTPPSTPTPPPALSETAPGPGSTATPPAATPTTSLAPPPVSQASSVVPVPPAPQTSSVVPVPPAPQTSSVVPPAGVTTVLPPAVVINSQTIPINSQGTFTVGTQTLTINSQGNVIIGTSTISAGGSAVTISGSTISIAPGGTEVVYGGTSTTSLGSIIASIFSSTTTTAAPAQYTGSATKAPAIPFSISLCLVFGLSGIIMWL